MTTDPVAGPNVVVPEWTLGWRLQRSLAHVGMTAEEMAHELGVVRATVSRWMHDRGAPPRAIYLKQWALMTGVPLGWLQTGDSPQSAADVTVNKEPHLRALRGTRPESITKRYSRGRSHLRVVPPLVGSPEHDDAFLSSAYREYRLMSVRHAGGDTHHAYTA